MSIITLNTRSLPDSAVTTAKIAADAVTDAKIADDVVGTEHLTANEVDTTALGADAVTAAQIADDAISEEHLDVTAITGHTAETSIADGDTLLIHDASASALRKMTKANFVSGVGGTNTPAFSAYSSVDRSINNTTATLVAANAENFDTDSAYDTSTYKFTPGVAGKYFLYFRYFYTGTFSSTIRGYIYKNGSDVAHNDFTHVQSDNGGMISTIVTSDTDDYFQAYTYQNSGSSRSIVGGTTLIEFGGYKLIGA